MGWQSVFRLMALAYYRWAMREIDPLHPDVPRIVVRIGELQRALGLHVPTARAAARSS